MSQKFGTVGSFVVGGSHVGWAETCVTLYAKTINEEILNSVLNNAALNAEFDNNIFPIARLFLEHETTKERTQILGIEHFAIRQDKRSTRGSFDMTILDSKTNNPRTAAYLDMLSPKNTYYLILEGGYRVNGVDYYVPILKGIKETCIEYYGRSSNSINITGLVS